MERSDLECKSGKIKDGKFKYLNQICDPKPYYEVSQLFLLYLFFTTNEIEIMFSFGLFLVHFMVSSIDIAFSLYMMQQQHYEALMSDMTSSRAE